MFLLFSIKNFSKVSSIHPGINLTLLSTFGCFFLFLGKQLQFHPQNRRAFAAKLFQEKCTTKDTLGDLPGNRSVPQEAPMLVCGFSHIQKRSMNRRRRPRTNTFGKTPSINSTSWHEEPRAWSHAFRSNSAKKLCGKSSTTRCSLRNFLQNASLLDFCTT